MNRKSISIAIFLSLIFVFSTQAGLKIGLKAGVNDVNARLSGDYVKNLKVDDLVGVQVGPILEFVPLGLGFDVALLYSNEGFKIADATIESVTTEAREYRLHQLLIPLNLKYKLPVIPKVVSVFATAGPSLRFQLGDNLKDQLKDQYEKKTFGVGLNVGLGVEVIKHLQLGFNWQWSLTDDFNNLPINEDLPKKIKGKASVKTISLAYFF